MWPEQHPQVLLPGAHFLGGDECLKLVMCGVLRVRQARGEWQREPLVGAAFPVGGQEGGFCAQTSQRRGEGLTATQGEPPSTAGLCDSLEWGWSLQWEVEC